MNVSDSPAAPEDRGAPPGYRLGNFELQAVVALHANGVVYRGWDHNLGIPVAIKECLPLRLARRRADGDIEPLDADTIDAFERGRHAFVDEARLLARCDHPSLLRVRHLLQAHGTAYRVMPWYVGRPLLDVRREMEDPPDEPALRSLLADLLGALDAYHRVAGVHGGINPAQILLLDDDRALLLGPAAARRATAIDAVESLMRQLEPSFAAPEQLAPSDQAPPGPWTDFYALARVVRFCISGMLPPSGSAAPEPLKETIDQLYFDAPGVRYSEQLLATLDAAASPQIEQRPQTVAEFDHWLVHGPQRRGGVQTTADAKVAPLPEAAGDKLQVAAPAIEPTESALSGVADRETVDTETANLIQRVIESIPERSGPPLHAIPPEPAWQADRDLDLPFTALPRRRRSPALWLAMAFVLLALIGYGAWELQRSAPSGAEPPTLAIRPSTAPAPATAQPMPALPTADPPPAQTTDPPPAAPVPPAAAAPGEPEPTASLPPLPVTPAAEPPAPLAATRGGPDNPRQVCGDRTQFSLYRCMQQQCATATWARHAQCLRLRATDSVD